MILWHLMPPNDTCACVYEQAACVCVRRGTLLTACHPDPRLQVVATEGPMALYKGFMPGWLRLGPWQLVFWCSYEQLRIQTGLGGFK